METKTKTVLLLVWQLQQQAMQIKEIVEMFGIKRTTAHHYIQTIQEVFNVEKEGFKYKINNPKPKV